MNILTTQPTEQIDDSNLRDLLSSFYNPNTKGFSGLNQSSLIQACTQKGYNFSAVKTALEEKGAQFLGPAIVPNTAFWGWFKALPSSEQNTPFPITVSRWVQEAVLESLTGGKNDETPRTPTKAEKREAATARKRRNKSIFDWIKAHKSEETSWQQNPVITPELITTVVMRYEPNLLGRLTVSQVVDEFLREYCGDSLPKSQWEGRLLREWIREKYLNWSNLLIDSVEIVRVKSDPKKRVTKRAPKKIPPTEIVAPETTQYIRAPKKTRWEPRRISPVAQAKKEFFATIVPVFDHTEISDSAWQNQRTQREHVRARVSAIVDMHNASADGKSLAERIATLVSGKQEAAQRIIDYYDLTIHMPKEPSKKRSTSPTKSKRAPSYWEPTGFQAASRERRHRIQASQAAKKLGSKR